MKIKLVQSFLFAIASGFVACSGDADVNDPTGSKNPPAQVINVNVKNLPGSAVIFYELPDDQNMKYVRASYQIGNATKNVNASFYSDSIVVDGFPLEGEYEVNLYSVSYGEAVSTPIVVKVNPTTPSYRKVRTTVATVEAFGGIKIEYDNPDKAKLGVGVIKKQAGGVWTQIYMHYSEAENGLFYVRGQEAVTSDFGIFVRDRWGNLSDTLYVNETPMFEEQCNKQLFRKMMLPTDTYECHSWNELTKANDMVRLWDGVTDADPTFQTKTTTKMPQWFTFDMGASYKLSRFEMISRFYPGKYGNTFNAGHPKHFEIWGSNNPNPNGSFDDSWILLEEYESVKPSGGGVKDAMTAEDKEAAEKGENFVVSDTAPAVRYIRFLTRDTWGNTVYMHLHELTFFGAKHE